MASRHGSAYHLRLAAQEKGSEGHALWCSPQLIVPPSAVPDVQERTQSAGSCCAAPCSHTTSQMTRPRRPRCAALHHPSCRSLSANDCRVKSISLSAPHASTCQEMQVRRPRHPAAHQYLRTHPQFPQHPCRGPLCTASLITQNPLVMQCQRHTVHTMSSRTLGVQYPRDF